MRLDRPFRGSEAVAAGLVTPKTLRGPRMRSLAPDVHVRAEVPDSLWLRAVAALVCRPGGVIRGRTAAALWVADADPGDVDEVVEATGPVEVVVPGVGGRSPTGIRTLREDLRPDEIATLGDEDETLRLTGPARTVFDVARVLPRIEAVVAADAVASRHRVDRDDVRAVAARHPGVRGCAAVPAVVALMDRRSTSARRTRVRLALRDAGLARPEVDPWLTDSAGETVGALDLAWRADRCGVQIGRTKEEARLRCGGLAELGWSLQWVPDPDPLDDVVARTAAMLRRARELRASVLRRRRWSAR